MAWVRFRKKEMPDGLWTKCPACGNMLYSKDVAGGFNVCEKCEHHMPATVEDRIRFTLDEDSFEELYADLEPVDRLEFQDKTSYAEKLQATAKKVGRKEAMVIGTGRIHGRDVVFGVMNFKFLGGSMGVVVGEKVTLAVELAMERKLPLILVCASGGARMHEGALSLMQMAKTCAALARLDDEGGLYISVLTDPTTGGVTASFATMADVVLAEPGALIGFAGPRVIQNTIRQELPEGFQRSEFLKDRGQIDAIVSRKVMKDELHRLLKYLRPEPGDELAGPTAAGSRGAGSEREGGAEEEPDAAGAASEDETATGSGTPKARKAAAARNAKANGRARGDAKEAEAGAEGSARAGSRSGRSRLRGGRSKGDDEGLQRGAENSDN